MFAICLEASHKKGMGHLFRMLNFASYLKKQNEEFVFLINDNNKTKEILQDENIDFLVIDLEDNSSHWENKIIDKYDIKYWINDRLDTVDIHTNILKKQNVKIITFDDLGTGAKHSDINVCGLFFNNDNLKGEKILSGVKYLILNDEINKYKKQRDNIKNILVTLGGSDTYGVTIKILRLLKKYNIKATIHIGPSFSHKVELEKELTDEYEVISFVSSMIDEFSKHDLAITGGGITPFEANASGLPCLVVANELFEIPNGEFLDKITSSKFLGYYDDIDDSVFINLTTLDIKNMSKNGMKNLNTYAVEKIYKEIKTL